MNYRSILAQLACFAFLVWSGVVLHHDISHALLSIASCLAIYWLAMAVCSSKKGRWIFYIPISLVICQVSITIKRGLMDVGFRNLALENPTGMILGDIIYGFKAASFTIGRVFGGVYEVMALDKYRTVQDLNIRIFTYLIMAIVMTCYIARRPARITAEFRDERLLPARA